eukprot:m.124009 g.124009  ORF g.124009 m.124009 type:complete len:675 (-) comp16276_c0_seq2:426-2450(-)
MAAAGALHRHERAFKRSAGLSVSLFAILLLYGVRFAVVTTYQSIGSNGNVDVAQHPQVEAMPGLRRSLLTASATDADADSVTTSAADPTTTTAAATLFTSTTTSQAFTSSTPDWENVECEHISRQPDACYFVKTADSCAPDGGFINYLEAAYCTMPLPLAAIILVFWLLILFVALGSTAEEFFCPALAVISKVLKLNDNVAGVTFLALGNGAPDIFSVFSSVNHVKDGFNLALGELFGAGVFITTVVIGTVAVISPFKVTRRPFIRDACCYLIATAFAFFVLLDGKISTVESIGFICIYALYVVVVILGRHLYQRRKSSLLLEQTKINARKALHREVLTPDHGLAGLVTIVDSVAIAAVPDRNIQQVVTHPHLPTETTNSSSTEDEPLIPKEHGGQTGWTQLFAALRPCDMREFRGERFFSKLYDVIKAPIIIALKLTTPVVDLDEDDQLWRKYLTVIQCLISPVLITLGVSVGFVSLGGVFPVYAIGLILGAVLAVLIMTMTSWDTVPRYHFLLSFVGFAASVIWIYVTANEIVNVLQTLGRILGIGEAVLGLTVLAWGNSVGDFVSDITVARQGFPQMAVGACFGSPALSMLLGIGISSLSACLSKANPFVLPEQKNHVLLTSGAFQMFSLVSSLVVIPLRGFRIDKYYAYYLFAIYAVYVALSVALEATGT